MKNLNNGMKVWKKLSEVIETQNISGWYKISESLSEPELIDMHAEVNKRSITREDYELNHIVLADNIWAKKGGMFENTFLKSILNSNIIDKEGLLSEGFTHFLEENDLHIFDILENTGIDSSFIGSGIAMTLKNPTQALKVLELISPVIESSMSKNAKKREKEAREKLDNFKDRNPDRMAMGLRSGKGAHKDPKAYTRKEKHKATHETVSESFSVGQEVHVDSKKGTVTIPKGPEGTIGVNIEGHNKMVKAESVKSINESLSMFLQENSENPLAKLRQLAGIKVNEAPLEVPPVSSINDLGPVTGMNGASPSALDQPSSTPLSGDPGMDSGMNDFDSDIDMGMDVGMDDTGMPGSIGSNPIEDPMDAASDLETDMGTNDVLGPTGPTGPIGDYELDPQGINSMATLQSPAYNDISNNIEQIRQMTSDIKMTEYKLVLQALQDLTKYVRSMGPEYTEF